MSKDSSSNVVVAPVSTKQLRSAKVFLLIFGTIALFFVGQLVGVYVVIVLLSLVGKSQGQIESLLTDNTIVQFLTILSIELVTLGILWWLHSLRKQPFLTSIGLGNKPTLKHLSFAVVTYIVYFVTLIITVAVVSSLIPSIDVNQEQQLGFDSASGLGLLFVFLTLVILPPITEEILFRGFLFRRLNGHIGIYGAAFITSAIFALAHTEFLGNNPLNWIAALDTFVLSFFLIYLLQKTKSLWPSIFLHGIKNMIAFTFLFIF
jgi:membrane protease YdiL (CAAX protease family)